MKPTVGNSSPGSGNWCRGARRGFVSRLMRLSYLSPDVLQRLVTQRVPLALSLNELIAVAELPWAEQMAHVLSGSNSQIG